jgi:hypothetical protein
MNEVIASIAARALEREITKPSVNAEPAREHTYASCFTLGKWCRIVAAGEPLSRSRAHRRRACGPCRARKPCVRVFRSLHGAVLTMDCLADGDRNCNI